MKLDRTELFEIMLIVVAVVGCWNLAALLPAQLTLGNILLDLSALLLVQSLMRDLWLLAAAKRKPAASPAASPRPVRCMCVESTVGATGVLLGLVLLSAGFTNQPIMPDAAGWATAVLLVLASGFIIKDWVFEFKPFGIRRDKNHMNIIVGWAKSQD